MNQQDIDKLKVIAREEAWDDNEDFSIDDYAGGNQDDAFYGGQRSGEINLAREVLTMLGEPW